MYLGRLALAAGEREQAVKYFQSALQVEGASEKARHDSAAGHRSEVQNNSNESKEFLE